MNTNLLNLISFWSAFFLSKGSGSVISEELIERFRELIGKLPDIDLKLVEIELEKMSQEPTISITKSHNLNQLMYQFILSHESEFDDEFSENINNIKMFFRD